MDPPVQSLASNPLPEGSSLGKFGDVIHGAAQNSGNASNIANIMKEEIEAAGFTNVHEMDFKWPIGDWSKHPIYKEAGKYGMVGFTAGFEGWLMWLLTRFGAPKPWSTEEVQVYLAHCRQELKRGLHIYQNGKRVWAQKPLDAKPTAVTQPVVENLDETKP